MAKKKKQLEMELQPEVINPYSKDQQLKKSGAKQEKLQHKFKKRAK